MATTAKTRSGYLSLRSQSGLKLWNCILSYSRISSYNGPDFYWE